VQIRLKSEALPGATLEAVVDQAAIRIYFITKYMAR